MTATLTFVILLLAILAGLLVYRAVLAVRKYIGYRGKRLVTCPETQEPAAVDVAARKAAMEAFLGKTDLRLDECSRWPERQDCGQDCLKQIQADPKNCLVWNIVSKWYEGQRCAYCQKPFGSLQHLDHVPALMGPNLQTVEWQQLRPEQLPEVLSTYWPVCWNCHVAEAFRRAHPELVVDRKSTSRRAM